MSRLLLTIIVFLVCLFLNKDIGILVGLFIILICLYRLRLEDSSKEVDYKFHYHYDDKLSYSGSGDKYSRLGMLESNIKKNVSSNILVTLTDEKRDMPKKINPVLSELDFSDVIVQYDLFFDEWHYILYFNNDYEVQLGISIDYKVEYSIYDESKTLLDSSESELSNIVNVLSKYNLTDK